MQSTDVKVDEKKVIKHLKKATHYKFLGVLENVKQEDKLPLECASKIYLLRMSIIWSSSFSEENRMRASNHFALPVLIYLIWTQTWHLADLRRIDGEARKIIVDNGGKHPLGSRALLYLQREQDGHGSSIC